MWDTSESNSESSSSGPDDLEYKDPTFRCRVRIDPPKILRKSGRFLKSVTELGSLFSVESKDKKLKKNSKTDHSRVVEKTSVKMPLCKNDYKGECGENGGCFCYCLNNKEGACGVTCVCLMIGMGDDTTPSSVPSMLQGDMGLGSKMGRSNVSQTGSGTDKSGGKSIYSGMKSAGAQSLGQIRDPDDEIDLQDLAKEMKSAMKDVSQSMRQVGLKIVECIGNYDMFYDDENMADSDVSVVHHTDIYKDPIYKHPYNSGGYQTSTGIYVETLIDHLPPEIIIEIREWGEI